MRKFWIVLPLTALIMAFVLPVSAADVKFSGSYVAQGYYDNNRPLLKDDTHSVANIWQRLRVQTDFQVQEGLKLTTRFDAMEKIWGAARTPILYTSTTAGGQVSSLAGNTGTDSAGNNQEAENIKFEHVYVSANLFGGVLAVGYQRQTTFGTAFGDSGDSTYGPRIKYDYLVGPWSFGARWDKIEGTQYYSSSGPAGNIGVNTYQVDAVNEKYSGLFIYDWGKGNAGLQITYYNYSATAGVNPYYGTQTATGYTTDATGYKGQYFQFNPYFKSQMGPVYVEGEALYQTGKVRKTDVAGGTDIQKDGYSAYISATVDFAPMYAGVNLIYAKGDDRSTTDKDEAGPAGGTDFNPMLMLFNYDLARWNGGYGLTANGLTTSSGVVGTYNPANGSQNAGIYNAQVAQVFFGVRPMPKLDVRAAYAFAQADKEGAAAGWVSKSYGSELDITATYKIYDNLSYMVGFGYLWAGDYFKGTNAAANLDNDYLVTHKLTLSF